MGLLDRLKTKKRQRWFVCHTCMMQTNHDALRSVFYYDGAPVLVLGRPLTRCPRCNETNTKSFQQLKEEGADAALWGLERLVKKYPRPQFEINPARIETRS